VVENMSGLVLPDGTTMQIFGEGRGKQVAESLSRSVGADVTLVQSAPDSAADKGLRKHRRYAVEPQARAGEYVADLDRASR
jgi:Mrp family chromosome partitioning ATPase